MHPLLTDQIARDHRARLTGDAAPRRPLRPARRRGLRQLVQAAVVGLARSRPSAAPAPARAGSTVAATTADTAACC